MIVKKIDDKSIEILVSALQNGEVVIIPTDTVYGFSGIVDEKKFTDSKIRKIKGREENKPFIQLISSPDEIFEYTNDSIPQKLLDCWPGALTLIVNDKKGGTTAFRCPGDNWLREIIEKVGFPLYSTSVNKSGFPILECEEEIISVFGSEVSVIVLDGDKKNALPSTLVKVENDTYSVIRQGTVKV